MKRGVKMIRFLAAAALVVAIGLIAYRFIARKIYPLDYTEFVARYAEDYDVPESLVYAVIKCESGFNPNARSGADAKGLMQLKDSTFQWVLTKDPGADASGADIFDPETNIKYGTLLLSLHRAEFGGDRLALAAYHAGRSAVNNWLSDRNYSEDGETLLKIPYKDTSHYIDKVLSAQKMYRDLYGVE